MKDKMPRRHFLNGGLGLGASLLAARAATAADPHDHRAMGMSKTLGMQPDKLVPPMDQPLREPEVRASVNGVLSTSIRCAYAYRQAGRVQLHVRSYEGGSPGPTLRLKPGDKLKISLTNDLPPNRDVLPMDMSTPHQFNNTNFHFHGAHCSPSGISDNVMRSMAPGHSYDIEIDLPKDHTRGTYWYHPHHHGSADIQMASGMVGAIVVEGDFADVPEIVAARERVMVLSQVVYDAFGMIENFEMLFPDTATRFLSINGQRRPVVQMRPGEVQRWRLVNAAYRDDMVLELAGHDLHAIAYDGIQLGAIEHRKQIVIAPGQRTDILVQAGTAGTYDFNVTAYDKGHAWPAAATARLVVAGEPMNMKLPTALPKAPLVTIQESEITGRRTVTFSASVPEEDTAGAAHWQEFGFYVDGKKFDPSRIDQRVKLGAVEEWTIVNTHTGDDHVFHIHVNPFQVIEINGRKLDPPQWRDSVIVERSGGKVVFRTRFLDYTGIYMLHCHMMNHEELGMMQTVEVYEE